MSVSQKQYASMTKKAMPKSKVLKNSVNAFWIGGLICLLGQVLTNLYDKSGLDIQSAKTVSTLSLIFLSALLTGIGVYDNVAKIGGAGTLVPITGFANSMVSPAIEFKKEGLILGVGAKMFTIAGPVIVYGVTASVVYGVIYWIMQVI